MTRRADGRTDGVEKRGIESGLKDVCEHQSLSYDSTDSLWMVELREKERVRGRERETAHSSSVSTKQKVFDFVVRGRATAETIAASRWKSQTVADLK